MNERYNIGATEDKWRKLWLESGIAPMFTFPDCGAESVRGYFMCDALARFNMAQGRAASLAPAHGMDQYEGLSEIVDGYGYDAVRLFVLSENTDAGVDEWQEAPLDGAWRFTHKLYRMVADRVLALQMQEDGAVSPPCHELQHKTQQILKLATKDMEAARLSKAIAHWRELANMLERIEIENTADALIVQQSFGVLLKGLSPIMPHITEELWALLGGTSLLVHSPWPLVSPDLVQQPLKNLDVHINGRLKVILQTGNNFDIKDAEALALADKAVLAALDGRAIKKVVVAKAHIVNIVTD